jgi:hypothetical protein
VSSPSPMALLLLNSDMTPSNCKKRCDDATKQVSHGYAITYRTRIAHTWGLYVGKTTNGNGDGDKRARCQACNTNANNRKFRCYYNVCVSVSLRWGTSYYSVSIALTNLIFITIMMRIRTHGFGNTWGPNMISWCIFCLGLSVPPFSLSTTG